MADMDAEEVRAYQAKLLQEEIASFGIAEVMAHYEEFSQMLEDTNQSPMTIEECVASCWGMNSPLPPPPSPTAAAAQPTPEAATRFCHH
jgi:hypothetical protein